MTTIQLPDDLLQELVALTGQPTPDAAALSALSDYLQYQRQLRVLDFEGQFDVEPDYDYKAQRRIQ